MQLIGEIQRCLHWIYLKCIDIILDFSWRNWLNKLVRLPLKKMDATEVAYFVVEADFSCLRDISYFANNVQN